MRVKVSSEYLYYYLYAILLANNWLGDLRLFSGIYELLKPIVICSALILIIVILLNKEYGFLEIFLVISLLLLGVYTAYITGSKWPLYSMVLISFSKNIDINKVIKITYMCMSLFLTIAISIFVIQYLFFPSALGVFIDGNVIKYNMTFIGANEAARYWCFWFILFIYLNMNKKISACKKVVLICVTVFFYVCTRSDTLLLIPLLACMKLGNCREQIRGFVIKYSGYSFFVIWMFSVIMLKMEGTWIFNIFNRFATGRFTLGIFGMKKYSISMFGQSPIPFYMWVGNATGHRLVLDNAYYMIMVQYGMIYLIIISLFFVGSRKCLNYRSSCCLLAYSIYAVAANTILSPTAIFPVVIAANLCWSSRRKKKFYYVK